MPTGAPQPAVSGSATKKSSTGLLIGIGAVVLIGAISVAAMMLRGDEEPSPDQQAAQSDPLATPPSPTDPAASPTPLASPDPSLTPTPTATPVATPAGGVPSTSPGRTGVPGATAGAPGSATAGTGNTAGRSTPTPTPTLTPSPTASAIPTPSVTPAARAGAPPVAANDTLATFPNVKLYTVANKRTSNRDVIVNFVNGQVLVMPRSGGDAIANVPYSRIRAATYTRGRDPKWDASLPGPDGIDAGTVFRGASHWLVVQGADTYAVVRLEDRNFRQIIETLEQRAGITVVRNN